jgi:hypothetical protein
MNRKAASTQKSRPSRRAHFQPCARHGWRVHFLLPDGALVLAAQLHGEALQAVTPLLIGSVPQHDGLHREFFTEIELPARIAVFAIRVAEVSAFGLVAIRVAIIRILSLAIVLGAGLRGFAERGDVFPAADDLHLGEVQDEPFRPFDAHVARHQPLRGLGRWRGSAGLGGCGGGGSSGFGLRGGGDGRGLYLHCEAEFLIQRVEGLFPSRAAISGEGQDGESDDEQRGEIQREDEYHAAL